VKLTQCEHRMLFLTQGTVSWLQTLLHCCDNNTVFTFDASRAYANSLTQKISKKQNQSVDIHSISENFQNENIKFSWSENKISSSFFESFWKCQNCFAMFWNFRGEHMPQTPPTHGCAPGEECRVFKEHCSWRTMFFFVIIYGG